MVYIYIRPSPPEQIFTPDKDHSKALGWLDLKEEKPDMVCAKSTKKQTKKQKNYMANSVQIPGLHSKPTH